jgi:YfiH family protein
MWRIDLHDGSVVFTDRRGGHSVAPYDSLNLGANTDDDPERVAANVETVRERLELGRIVRCRQVHGDTILDADAMAPTDDPEGDGLTTAERGVGLMVTVADCLPIALVAAGRATMLHCGWRGLATRMIARAVAQFDPVMPTAVIGPCIGSDAYAVGTEVPHQIGHEGLAAYEDGRLDLRAVARAQLMAAGVHLIEEVEICTYANPQLLFSHRRERPTGRQAGVAWLI